MKYFVLRAYGGRFSNRFANGRVLELQEVDEEEAASCPVCGSYMSLIPWRPPYQLILEDFRRFGDFLFTPGWDFFMAESVVKAFRDEGLTGIVQVYPAAEIVKIGGRGKAKSPPPAYHLVEIVFGGGDIDDKASGIVRKDKKLCSTCRSGPFMSARYGCDGHDRLILKRGSWTGEDLFHPIGMTGVILASQRFVDFCIRHRWTNVSFVPAEHACEYYGLRPDKPDPRLIITPGADG